MTEGRGVCKGEENLQTSLMSVERERWRNRIGGVLDDNRVLNRFWQAHVEFVKPKLSVGVLLLVGMNLL